MNYLNIIKTQFYSVLSTIDKGTFFTKPLKWLYLFNGVIAFLLPIIFLVVFFNSPVKFMMDYGNAWTKIVGYLAMVLFFVFLIFVAYLNFLLWKNRKDKLSAIIREGDETVVVPLFADMIQTSGECNGFIVGIVPTIGVVFYFVFLLLTGSDNFYSHFFEILIMLVAIAVVCMIVGWMITFLAHFIGEKLRMSARITNDLKDIADVHRATNPAKAVSVEANNE